MQTLYQLADSEIRSCIDDYLALAADTNGFTSVSVDALRNYLKIPFSPAGEGWDGGLYLSPPPQSSPNQGEESRVGVLR